MAAYLVGKRGRVRDVVTVGATVTLTHTAGVLGIGLLLSVSASLAPTVVEQDLAVLSGLIVAAVGLWLLISSIRGKRTRPTVEEELAVLTDGAPLPSPAAPASALAYAGSPSQSHPSAGAPAEHDHDHGDGVGHHRHSHPHGSAGAATGAFSRKGLVGLGVAGGLVPSPSALLVLLAAIALGRTAFGIVLILGYGLGMAMALTAAGLLLLRLRGRIGRIAGSARLRGMTWLVNGLPVLTACLVLVVGLGLALQALTGTV
jgi:ABC-type nickel/cobalt efflux system permease component RcnA